LFKVSALVIVLIGGAAALFPFGASPQSSEAMPPPELDALLARLQVTLGDLKSLHANFEQEKHLSIFQDVVRSSGELFFAPPGRIRIQMLAPFQSALIADGKSVAQYEYMDGRWQRIRSGGEELILAVTGQIAAWLQGDFRNQTDLYSLSGLRDENPRIVLTPIDPEFAKRIARIEITIAQSLTTVSRIEIHEPGGDCTALSFSGHRRNEEVSLSIFATNGPAPIELPPAPSAKERD